VRREDLYSSPSSTSPSPDREFEDIFRSRLGPAFEPTPAAFAPLEQTQKHGDEGEDEVEFRLFAAASKDANRASQKIRIQSPEADDRPPGLVNPYRDRSCYFAAELSVEQRAQHASVVLSTQDVVVLSKQPWPGAHLPWRVTRLSASGRVMSALNSHASASAPATVDDAIKKRTRPGKKARIAARKKLAAKRAKQELASQSKAEKEAAEREKRTQRNREKKVKKKERDKAKKMMVGAGTDVDHDHEGGVADT
ncbi:hypothetical protein LTS18_005005, partial [Coniosporium uncinatum]